MTFFRWKGKKVHAWAKVKCVGVYMHAGVNERSPDKPNMFVYRTEPAIINSTAQLMKQEMKKINIVLQQHTIFTVQSPLIYCSRLQSDLIYIPCRFCIFSSCSMCTKLCDCVYVQYIGAWSVCTWQQKTPNIGHLRSLEAIIFGHKRAKILGFKEKWRIIVKLVKDCSC